MQRVPMTARTSISVSLAWMSASQLLGVALQLCAQIVLARVLSLYETGIYAIAIAVVGFLSLLQSIGLQAFIVREKHLTPSVLATAFTVNAAMSLLIALAMVVVGLAGARFLGDPGVGHVLYAMAFVPVIGIAAFQPLALLEREGRFRAIGLIQTAASLSGAIVTITAALTGASFMSAAFGQIAMAVVQAAAMIVIGRTMPPVRFGLERWREVADFAGQMLAISGISNLGARLSDIILGRLLGLSALGLYSRASGLNILIWSNLHLLVGRVLFVDFSDIFRRGKSLRDRYIAAVDMLTAFLWPVFAGFATLSGPFIAVVFGEKWVPARGAVIFLALSSIIQVAITMTNELFAATNTLRTQTRIEFIRASFALATFIAGCLISIEAAAAARAAESLFAVFLYRGHINRMTDTAPSDLNPIYLRNALVTAVTCLPPCLASAYWGWSPYMPMAWVVGSALVGGACWIAMLALLRHRIWMELHAIRARRATGPEG
jgi:O-antigen/teichoic acid export membrane protein